MAIAVVLALLPVAPDAHAAETVTTDTVVDCGFTSAARTDGYDRGSTPAATYEVSARWCVETTYETRTITEEPSAEEAVSDASDDAKVDKAKKKQKGKKGRKAKRARRRAKRSKAGSSRTTTRTERRVVSTCMTDFEIDAEPQTHVTGAHLIGVTTTALGGNACATRSYQVVGRFGRDYVPDVSLVSRSVISQKVGSTTVQNYPLGRFGHFDITVHFARDGGATCDRCFPAFEFCDVRIVTSDDYVSCVRL